MFFKVKYNNGQEMTVSNKETEKEVRRLIRITKGNVNIESIEAYDYDLVNHEIINPLNE